jgi:hypothetical protein
MTDARSLIAQTLRCAGVLLPNNFEDFRTYEQKIDGLAAEIDKALGGLTRETSHATRVCSFGPCEGKSHHRWVSGWTPEEDAP